MATKGDISDLDALVFGGEPIIPQVSGFSRVRRSGVIQSDSPGGRKKRRKKNFSMPHVSDVAFYLGDVFLMDFMQAFINRNEGRKFICYLAADQSTVEPYVCQAISEWSHPDVNAVEGSVKCQFEIFSTNI